VRLTLLYVFPNWDLPGGNYFEIGQAGAQRLVLHVKKLKKTGALNLFSRT
jgi:hypothetical protein